MAPKFAAAEIEDPASMSSQTASLLTNASTAVVGRTKCLVVALASASLSAAVVAFLMHRSSSSAAADLCLTRSCVRAAAALIDSIDATAPPCDDFYAHSCGRWATANPMPADSSSYSTFAVLSERNDAVLRSLLERPEAGDIGSPTGMARAYYSACMDENTIEQLGARPLAPLLTDVSWAPASEGWAASDWEDLSARLGRLQRSGTMPLFYWWAMADEANSTANVMHVGQSGLGLPSPEYYKKNPGDDPYLRAYSTYLDRLLALAAADGALPPPAAAAAAHPARRAGMVRAALAFETELAAAFVPKAELREPQAYYEPVPSLGELQRLTDGRAGQRLFRWQAFVDAYYAGDATEGGGVPQGGSGTPGVGSPPSPLVLSGSRYLSRAFSSVVHGTNVSTVQVYLQLQVLQEYARHLSDAYVQATFELNKVLSGALSMPERWKRCVARTDDNLGYATGRLFVDELFSSSSRAAALQMIGGIKAAFKASLPELAWLDKPGAVLASRKVDTLYDMIGYPGWITDDARLSAYYAGLSPGGGGRNGSYLEWLRSATALQVNENIRDLGLPVDRRRWGMTAPTVNAYYSPPMNLIAFPAGILQPPFWHGQEALSALNYGGVGSVIGHELTHGFDDQGSRYDEHGNLDPWWSPDEESRFSARTSCLRAQYGAMTNTEGEHIDANLTMGENIADNGGIRSSHAAWVAAGGDARGGGQRLPGLGEYSPAQLFFLSYAQVWCGSVRPSEAHKDILSDPHAPPRARVNAVVQNTPAFASAFGCPAGAPMNPVHKCEVWA